MKKHQKIITLDKETNNKLKAIAAIMGKNANQIINELIEGFVKGNEGLVEIIEKARRGK